MTKNKRNMNQEQQKNEFRILDLALGFLGISLGLFSYVIIWESLSDNLRFDLEIQIELAKQLLNF